MAGELQMKKLTVTGLIALSIIGGILAYVGCENYDPTAMFFGLSLTVCASTAAAIVLCDESDQPKKPENRVIRGPYK